MPRRIPILAVAAACVLLAGTVASATPQQDFNEVYADWKADNDVTPCAFSRRQLQSAYDVATGSPDFQYSTDFSDEVQREIARWKSGRCAGVSPAKARNASPLNGARIISLRGRGSASKEYVKIKNTTRRTLSFAKATLRDRKRAKARFPSKFKLRARKTAVVRIGCAPGRKRASVRGTRVWLCRRAQLFRDSGDAARLADRRGTIVSQRGFGTEARRIAY
jgi:hypothetical protein